MEINSNSVVTVLRDTSGTIAEATNAVKSGGFTAAMPFFEPIMHHFSELKEFGKLEGISATTEGASDVKDAIFEFLTNAKQIEDAVGPMGAAIFSKPEILEVKTNLEAVLFRLDEDRGGKVKGIDPGGVS